MLAFRHYYPRLFLVANGIIYCGLALMFVADSPAWFARLGVELQSESGFTELNATYIGLMSSLGCFSLLGAFKGEYRSGAALIAMISYFALAAVRAWGVFGKGNPDELMTTLLSVEVISFLLSGFAVYCLREEN